MVKTKNYELIEHTADIGIRIRTKDLKELFKKSALAMFDIIAEKKSLNQCFRMGTSSHQPPVKKIIIKQEANNLDELFINWLNELLSLSATKEMIFFDFKIDKLDDVSLNSQAIGCDIGNYKVNTEIKAATYHKLRIEKAKSGWVAEVIFDV
jgi:SHS2 domain-containing protein